MFYKNKIMKQKEEHSEDFDTPEVTDMNKVYKIDFSDKVYIAAAMNSGRVFYAVSVTFNGREQALIYCPRFNVFFMSTHGGQDLKDRTQIRFLSDEPLVDVPTRIKRLFSHMDQTDCVITQINDDLFYQLKPAKPFEEKEKE